MLWNTIGVQYILNISLVLFMLMFNPTTIIFKWMDIILQQYLHPNADCANIRDGELISRSCQKLVVAKQTLRVWLNKKLVQAWTGPSPPTSSSFSDILPLVFIKMPVQWLLSPFMLPTWRRCGEKRAANNCHVKYDLRHDDWDYVYYTKKTFRVVERFGKIIPLDPQYVVERVVKCEMKG